MKHKVCLVLPSLSMGGMERVMIELANYFSSQRGIDTHLLIMTKREHFFDVPAQVVIHEPDFAFGSGLRIISTIRTLFFVRKKVKALKPDALLSFGEMFNSFVIFSTLGLKIRVFVSDRSKPDKRWGAFHTICRAWLYRYARGIISQTGYSKKYLEKVVGHQNIEVIPNPLSVKLNGTFDKGNVILSVGRLIKTKRVDFLLDVFAQLDNQDWELWIVGDGPQRQFLEDRVVQLNITEKVKFWGKQKNLEWFYSSSRIFAFTSVSEGFPNALLEAMGAGLACISFDCVAGPADMIEDGVNGILVPELDFSNYLVKLRELTSDSGLVSNFAQRATEIKKEYTIESIGDRYLNFLFE